MRLVLPIFAIFNAEFRNLYMDRVSGRGSLVKMIKVDQYVFECVSSFEKFVFCRFLL